LEQRRFCAFGGALGLWFWDLGRKTKDAKMDEEALSPTHKTNPDLKVDVRIKCAQVLQLIASYLVTSGISRGGGGSKHHSPSAEALVVKQYKTNEINVDIIQ